MNDISHTHTHTPSPVAHVPTSQSASERAGLVPAGVAQARVDFTPEEYAAAAARIASALNDGWDPAKQLDDANLDISTFEAMNSAAGKVNHEKHGPSLLAFQELFIQLMNEIRKAERESAATSREIAANEAVKSFETQMHAADKEYSAALKKGIGQIVQGVGQSAAAFSTPNVATAQAVGAGLGGMSELISAGDQQDASQARARATLMDKNRETYMDDARRAQENAANAAQAMSELTRAAGETLAANAELAKVVSRSS